MDYAEAIKALNDYFEGKDMKRGDALRIAELLSRAEKAEKIVDEYAESARDSFSWCFGCKKANNCGYIDKCNSNNDFYESIWN